jgi:hypothetical protein
LYRSGPPSSWRLRAGRGSAFAAGGFERIFNNFVSAIENGTQQVAV